MEEVPGLRESGMKLKLEDGKTLKPEDWMEVRCEVHSLVTTWGALDPIQQLAVEAGLDTFPELPCLLAPREVSAD